MQRAINAISLTIALGFSLTGISSAQPTRSPLEAPTQLLVDRLVFERAAVLASVATRADERELHLLRNLADQDRQIRTALNDESQATVEIDRLTGELTQITAQRRELTQRLSEAYDFEADLAEYRRRVTSIANSSDPRRRAALERYASGDRAGALLVLLEIQEAETRAVAAGWREIGALALDMLDRGERTNGDVLPIYQAAQRLDPSDHWGWIELSRLLQKAGRFREAASAAEAALAQASDDRSRGVALNELSSSLSAAGDSQSASARLRESVAVARRVAAAQPEDGDRRRDLEVALLRLGHQQLDARATGDARESFREALAIAQDLAVANPERVQQQEDLGGAILDLGRATENANEAHRLYERGLAIFDRLVREGGNSLRLERGLSLAHESLGTFDLQVPNDRSARSHFERSLAINRDILASDPDDRQATRFLLIDLESLGGIAGRANDMSRARRYFQEMYDVAQRALNADPDGFLSLDSFAKAADGMARLSRAEGQAGQAQAYWLEHLRIRQRLAGQAPNDARVQWDVVMAYGVLGYMPGNEHYLSDALRVAADLERRAMLTPENQRTVQSIRERAGIHR